MAEHSKIEWTDATWNPITGCSVVSAGCKNCYAMKLAGTRLRNHPSRKGLTQDSKNGPVWTGEVRLNTDWLDQPLHWTRPRMIFVCAHGDLFAEGVPDKWIDRIFAVMALCPRHTFQVLTKRSARMREYLGDPGTPRRIYELACDLTLELEVNVVLIAPGIDPTLAPPGAKVFLDTWPLRNVWLGVSVEDQKTADARIPDLLQTPAAVRFVSYEPALGPVDFTALDTGSGWVDALQSYIRYPILPEGHFRTEPIDLPSLDWIIAGGESGPQARPAHPDWFRSVRDQCAAAGTAFLFKQWGEWAPGECADGPVTRTERTADLCEDGTWSFSSMTPRMSEELHRDDEPDLYRLGKTRAGRLLDGVEHNGFPPC